MTVFCQRSASIRTKPWSCWAFYNNANTPKYTTWWQQQIWVQIIFYFRYHCYNVRNKETIIWCNFVTFQCHRNANEISSRWWGVIVWFMFCFSFVRIEIKKKLFFKISLWHKSKLPCIPFLTGSVSVLPLNVHKHPFLDTEMCVNVFKRT